jgi:hypothetical protein
MEYFLLLKCIYKKEVEAFIKSYINYIDKLAFLVVFTIVY